MAMALKTRRLREPANTVDGRATRVPLSMMAFRHHVAQSKKELPKDFGGVTAGGTLIRMGVKCQEDF
jgi:hypothetical protein